MKPIVPLMTMLIGGAIGAVGHAFLTQPSTSTTASSTTPVVRRDAPPPVVACRASLGPSDLAALRAEVDGLLDERLGARNRAAPEANPPAPTPQAIAAEQAATRCLDAALTQGRWDEANRNEFRAALIAMDPTQRDAAMSRLVVALNEGKLRPNVEGPIL